MIEYLFIAGRVAAGPAADFYKKRLADAKADSLFVVLITFAFVAAVSWPGLFFAKMPDAGSGFWFNMAAASVFDTVGMVFVMLAIGATELSLYGPLNAYKPAIALALGSLFLGEKPGVAGIAGVAVIVAGSVLLSYAPGEKRGSFAGNLRSKGVWFRLLSILLFCVGVIFLKRAVMESSPFMVLFFWALFGLVLCTAAALAMRDRDFKKNISVLRGMRAECLGVCVSMTIVQATTLLSFGFMFVGYAIALFQLACLPDVFLGGRFFGERNIAFRLMGAIVMIGGALLIVFIK